MVNFAPSIPIQTRLTVADFEALLALPEYQNRLLELIEGEIHEKMPTEVHGTIAHNLHGEFYLYQKLHPQTIRVSGEARHALPDDPYNDRIPDVAVNVDIERASVERGAIPKMPDLAVEIKSPDDTYAKMRAKAVYYVENGTRLVWLVYPERQEVEVFRPEVESVIYKRGDTLDGGDLLPDLRVHLADIFAV